MLYRDTEIEELMTDALVHSAANNEQATFKNRIGYFLKSSPVVEVSDNKLDNNLTSSKATKSPETSPVQEGAHGTLPESVLIHPSIGYSFRYGNVMLNGLDNSMNFPPVNNGSWRP